MANRPTQYQSIAMQRINKSFVEAQVTGDHSIETLWEKAYLCPCRNPESQQPNPNCKRCMGTGIAYLPPVTLKCIITSQSKGVHLNDIGQTDSGIAYGTPETKEADINGGMSFRDRICLPDVKISQSFIFNVTQDRIDNGLFLYYDVNTIDFASSRDHGDLVEGQQYRMDYDTNRIYPVSDLLSENITLNMRVTLRYLVVDLLKECRYEFKPVTLSNKQTMNQYTPLPKKLLLRREDAFVRSESFSLGTGDTTNMVDPKRGVQIDTSGFSAYFGNLNS